MRNQRVVIIGGGLAGISAALELKLAKNNTEVILLENRNRLGGATWSFEKDGVNYDNGQHVFLRCCDAYLEFLDRIGSRNSVYIQPKLEVPVVDLSGSSPKYSYISRMSRYLFPSLLFYKHLSKAQRFHVVKTALKLKRLDSSDVKLDEISFGDWLIQNGESHAAIEKLWNLIVLPTINVDAMDASLKLAAKVFNTALLGNAKNDIGWGLKPFSELHDLASQKTLAQLGVEVVFNAKVERIENNNDLEHKIYTPEKTYTADSVILAVPHDQLLASSLISPKDLISDSSQINFEQLDFEKLGTSSILNIHFVFDRQIMKQKLLAGVGTEVQYIFDRTQAAGLDKESSQTQCLAISLSGADKYLPRNAKELEEHFFKELIKIFPKASQAKLLNSMVTRENSATFRGAVGSHVYRVKTETKIKGVFMAGAWTDTQWPATMEGAVRSGKKAAEMALLK